MNMTRLGWAVRVWGQRFSLGRESLGGHSQACQEPSVSGLSRGAKDLKLTGPAAVATASLPETSAPPQPRPIGKELGNPQEKKGLS